MRENIAPASVEFSPPLSSHIEEEDVDYKPEDEKIAARTGEEEHSGLAEPQNVEND